MSVLIFTKILIAMDYFFYLYISDNYFQFRKKSILIWATNFIMKSITKGIKISAKRLFSFPIIVAIQHEASGYTFYKVKKTFSREHFCSPNTSYRAYLLRNCFSNCDVYLRDMYITLKGTGKILFTSLLRIQLICKFLNFTATFTKKI